MGYEERSGFFSGLECPHWVSNGIEALHDGVHQIYPHTEHCRPIYFLTGIWYLPPRLVVLHSHSMT